MDLLAIGIAALMMTAFLIGKHLGRVEGRISRDNDLVIIGEEHISMRIKKSATRDDIERFLQALLESEHFKNESNKNSGKN